MARLIHDYVVDALKGADVDEVKLDTGISPSTLRKIRDGHIKNPGIKSMEILYFYFRNREGADLRRRVRKAA